MLIFCMILQNLFFDCNFVDKKSDDDENRGTCWKSERSGCFDYFLFIEL